MIKWKQWGSIPINATRFQIFERKKRTVEIIKDITECGYYSISTIINEGDAIGCVIILSLDIPIMDRYSNGSYVVKDRVSNSYIDIMEPLAKDVIETMEFVEEKPIKKEEREQLSFDMLNRESLKELDDRMVIINNFLDNVEGK